MKIMERAAMMNGRRFALAVALALVTTQAVQAVLPDPLYSTGVVSRIQNGVRIVDVAVNAYVWNIADYKIVNPTFNLTAGNFVYEYIVHNLDTSTVSISMFQVPVAAPELINSITTVGTVGGVGATALIVDPDTLPSATYLFISPALARNTTSCKLVYTSNYGIDVNGNATIGGGSISGDIVMPTPIPEPVSALLLGLGGLAIARKRLS